MRGTLLCIQTNGAVSSTLLIAPPHISTLRRIVQGHIEVIPYFDCYEGTRCIAFCNEEGKLHELPLNPYAQIHWLRALGVSNANDHLAGNVAVVIGDDELLEAL